jgi:hypothetical protein
VTRYAILAHPTEHGHAVAAVEYHRARFAHPSGLVAADRGVHATDPEARLGQLGSATWRDSGLGKCRYHRLDGRERWLGLGLVRVICAGSPKPGRDNAPQNGERRPSEKAPQKTTNGCAS